MNDYSNAFHLAAPWWAEQGVTTYAYDQRGFGRSPGRGIWAGDDLMTEDLRTVAVAGPRASTRTPILVVVGESMGGAVAAEAFASDRPPAADRLVLLSPGGLGLEGPAAAQQDAAVVRRQLHRAEGLHAAALAHRRRSARPTTARS